MAADIVNDLRAISQFVGGAGLKLREVADLLDSIDALPDKCPDEPYDGYDDFGIGKGLGWEQAMKLVKAILRPEEADHG